MEKVKKIIKMAVRKATIQNSAGIHVRPAGYIISQMAGHECEIIISKNNEKIELVNVMSLLVLGLCKGDTAVVEVKGPDEKEICDKLVELLEKVYDFPPVE